MKRIITLVLAAVLLLSAMAAFTVTVAAEEVESSFKFGTADVNLTLVENFNSVEASPSYGWGSATSVDGMLRLATEGQAFCDTYQIKTGMLSSATTYSGVENFVFSIKDNRSDGDILFSLQPCDASMEGSGTNLFTGWMEEHPLWLVDANGKAEKAKQALSLDLANGRATYVIPMGFEGYLVFPVAAFVNHGDWTNSYYSDASKLAVSRFGFHVALDDAMYAEFCIDDAFVCGALPAYEAPVEGMTTAPEATAPETTVATPDAETTVVEAETTVADATETDATEAETTAAATEPASGGCGAAIGALAALPAMAIVSLVLLRKRED